MPTIRTPIPVPKDMETKMYLKYEMNAITPKVLTMQAMHTNRNATTNSTNAGWAETRPGGQAEPMKPDRQNSGGGQDLWDVAKTGSHIRPSITWRGGYIICVH